MTCYICSHVPSSITCSPRSRVAVARDSSGNIADVADSPPRVHRPYYSDPEYICMLTRRRRASDCSAAAEETRRHCGAAGAPQLEARQARRLLDGGGIFNNAATRRVARGDGHLADGSGSPSAPTAGVRRRRRQDRCKVAQSRAGDVDAILPPRHRSLLTGRGQIVQRWKVFASSKKRGR